MRDDHVKREMKVYAWSLLTRFICCFYTFFYFYDIIFYK